MSAIGDDARRTLAELARARRARRAGGGGPPPVKARVRCGGEWHRIVLTPEGRLSFLDHTREEVRQGDFPPKGESCRCSDVLFWWRWFTTRGQEGQGEALPKALRAAAWERRRFGGARRGTRPGLKYLNDLAIGPFHQRPGCLTRVIGNLTRFLWSPAVACRVRYGRGAHELVLSTHRRSLQVSLQRDWFCAIYRKGLAFIQGCLVVKVEEPASYAKDMDLVCYCCRPVLSTQWGLDFTRYLAFVARGPAGDFRVVRWDWWRD